MANFNVPSGLSPKQYLNGARWSGQARLYFIPSTDANAYAIGDPVKTLTGGASAGGISAVTLATAGDSNPIRGVIISAGGAPANSLTVGAGFYDPNNLNTTVIPATKTQAYWVAVVDDPMVIFEVQEFSSTGSTNFTVADIGKNCNLKAGTNNGFLSQWVLDDTAASATTSTRQVRILELSQRKDNAIGSFAKWLVLINNHELKAAVAGL